MLIDDKGRLFKRINLIDLLIIVIILAAGIFLFNKFGKAKIMTPFEKTAPVQLTFVCESLPEYSADAIKENAVVTDKVSSATLGRVISAEKGPDISYAADNNGKYVKSSKEGYSSIVFTVEGSGLVDQNGVANIGNSTYYINRSDYNLYVGNVTLFCRLKDIEKK